MTDLFFGTSYRREIAESVIKKLLTYGANVNIRRKDGLSALMIAIKHRLYDVVSNLLKHGTDVNMYQIIMDPQL